MASARAQFKINTHGCWHWHLCIPDGLSVVQCSLGHDNGIVFIRHNFSGMKQTCWTTGSWRCCLSLEIVSSIPARSTIIYRFLCGFICVSLWQSIKIKPTYHIYIYKSIYQFFNKEHQIYSKTRSSIRNVVIVIHTRKITYRSRTTHIQVSELRQYRVIIWNNDGLLTIGPRGTYSSKIWIKCKIIHSKKPF